MATNITTIPPPDRARMNRSIIERKSTAHLLSLLALQVEQLLALESRVTCMSLSTRRLLLHRYEIASALLDELLARLDD
jgi:tmRNA-binding protein